MYISSLYYNMEGWRKVAVCIYHHFIITRKNKEKLQYVYLITLLQHGRMKKSCCMYISSLHYNKEGWGKVAVCIYHHFIITRKDKEKLQYVYLIALLQHGRMKKSCGIYISSLHYNKEGWRKVALCIYHHLIITRKDKEKLRCVYIITSCHYNKEGWGKVAVCIYQHFIITRKGLEKLRYVYIITSL